MSRSLTKTQREKIAQFSSVTGAPASAALDCLQLTNWALEPAVDYFYSSGISRTVSRSAINHKSLREFFEQYKDANSDVILAEGILQLCEDLNVEPEDLVMLVLSWHLKAQTMGEYTRSEFEGGMERLGVDSLDKLKAKLPRFRSELNDPSSFKEIYNYAYLFSREKGQKCVQLETALAMWQLLVTPEKWKRVGSWCEFLRQRHKRAISKDTWTQLLEFMSTIEDDFSNYDENGAWPYLIDEFVAWEKERMIANGDHPNVS